MKEKPISFIMAVRRLFAVLKWKFSKMEYLNKKVNYRGSYYAITGETFDYFFVAKFPKIAFRKVGNPYKIR